MELRISYTLGDARKILVGLLSIEVLLIVVYLTIHILATQYHWGPSRTLFDLDDDLSIPSWFSSIQFIFIAAFLFLAYRYNHDSTHVSSWFLVVACLVFVFLSADESAAIHEKVTLVALTFGLDWMLIGGQHGAWITLYAIIGAVLAVAGIRPLLNLWRYYRRETLLAALGGAIFFMGAVGFEVISYLFLRVIEDSVQYKVEVAVEEFLEMSGVSIIFYATSLFTAKLFTASDGLSVHGGAH